MEEARQKREQFHNQIRRKQHQQIFKKMRVQAQQQSAFGLSSDPNISTTNNYSSNQVDLQQLNQLVNNLDALYKLSSSIQNIVLNQDKILQFIRQVRKFESNIHAINAAIDHDHKAYDHYSDTQQPQKHPHKQYYMIKYLQYLSHVCRTIYQHIQIDAQQSHSVSNHQQSSEQLNNQRLIPYSQLLLPINYMLINMLAEELPMQYLFVMHRFTKYRIFIDCFHNLFLTQNIPKELKLQYVNQLLTHLQENPLFYLRNCYVYMKIIFYSIEQQPKLTRTQLHGNSQSLHAVKQYEDLHTRIIRNIETVSSILTYNDKLQQTQKQYYRRYSFLVLRQLCNKNKKNCWETINCVSIMKGVELVLDQLKLLFNYSNSLINKSTSNGKNKLKNKVSQFCVDHIVQCIKLLITLGSYDEVVSCLSEYYPLIWLYLVSIFRRFSLQFWMGQDNKNRNSHDKNMDNIPHIFNMSQFTIIVTKILNCISNFVCVPELCQYFIKQQYNKQTHDHRYSSTRHANGYRGSWIRLLTQVYNTYYKTTEIRIQCLCIFSNVLIAIEKSNLPLEHQQQNSTNIQQDYNYSDRTSPNNVSPTKLQLINQSTDLILQILKLSNHNKNIIICVLQTLTVIIQNLGSIVNKCQLFRQTWFINRLNSIAENDFNIGTTELNGFKGGEFYSEDVRIKARHFLQAIMINNQ